MPDTSGQCLACQRIVRPGTQFCPACGHNLLAAVAAPARRDSGVRFEHHLVEIKRVAWLFGLILATLFVASLVARSIHSPWPGAIGSAIIAAITLVAVGLRYRRLLFLFKLHPLKPGTFIALVVIAVVFVGAISAYFWILQRLGTPMSSATAEFARAGWPLWSMALLVSLMPAVFEEIAFRGVIQSALERVLNARDAWLIQAALFSVLHLSPLVFPSHFVMGLCFGYMRKISRSIYPGMLLHASWNALVLFRELAI